VKRLVVSRFEIESHERKKICQSLNIKYRIARL